MMGPSLRAKMFLQVLRKARHGTVEVQFPDGVLERFGEGEPRIRVEVRRWDALELLFRKGDMGLAEAILDEWLIVDDVATSGSHLEEAVTLLRPGCGSTLAVAWIGAGVG